MQIRLKKDNLDKQEDGLIDSNDRVHKNEDVPGSLAKICIANSLKRATGFQQSHRRCGYLC